MLGYNTNAFPTHSCILHGSPLSLILFLFNNANPVQVCISRTFSASRTGFVNNMNALAFGNSTEENCIMLQTVNERNSEWAQRHEVSIASEKYILVHFTKAGVKHNSACPLNLPTSIIYSSFYVHILGIILDKKFRWQPHLQHIKSKLATQTNILTRLIASI
jgi:ribose 5-phosphate isomerase RpiB